MTGSNSARRLDDLRIVQGERKGRHSIVVNGPMRLCFLWSGRGAKAADTALRLAAFFGTSEGFWMGLQADYDLEEARTAIAKELLRVEQARAEYRVAGKP